MKDILLKTYGVYKKISRRIRTKFYLLSKTRLEKIDLIMDIRALGVVAGDVIFVHSSLSRMGYLEGGPDALIDALIEVLGEEGTLLMPAFTILNGSMKNTLELGVCFDYKQSRVSVGAIPERFRKRTGVLRSLHPTHSVAAVGKLAHWITEGHENAETIFGRGTPLHKFLEVNGKILGIGVDMGPVTFYHVIEDVVNNFPIEVYFSEEFEVEFIDRDGNIKTMSIRPHDPDVAKTRIGGRGNIWIKEFLTKTFHQKSMLSEGYIGEAKSWIINAADIFDTQVELMESSITIYTTKEEYKRILKN